MLGELTTQLLQGQALADDQVRLAIAQLIEEQIPAEAKAEFLAALARKGETTNEIAAFARELRDRAIQPPLDPETRQREILDVCGTGGDRLNTFNISTTVALVVSAAGVAVAKHGNRAITSKSGSADVLEELGIPIDLTPEQAATSLREHNFAFFFAPKYHPAFKHIGPARKLCAERGQRTIFNFLGPLLNPARPSAQLIGVPQPELCEPMARVLQSLGVRRGMVVSGAAGEGFLDELSTLGGNTIAEFYQDRGFSVSALPAESFALSLARLSDLAGGDRAANARTVRELLAGRERGPKRDAVLLNAGAALFVAAKTRSMHEAIQLASEVIDSGQALAKLEELSSAKP
ncbi:MAG: anthranilate phosphoribosyltransferase [Verrucomicrobia bacterium]|nr:anthranilate phosphoribosyltransferase [Verrucomicrobiota bacterium]